MTHDATRATSPPTSAALTNLRLGTAPDSWGVWFPDDPRQVPWGRFLDQAAEAGYDAVALGPFGYLPTHPEQLRDELGRRGLALSGGTAGTALHRGDQALTDALAECRQVATLLAALDAPYLVTLPAMYTDLYTGALLEPADLTPDQWVTLGAAHSQLGKAIFEETGVAQMFHLTPTHTSPARTASPGSSSSPTPPPSPCAWIPATSPAPAATTTPSLPSTLTASATST